MNKTLKYIFILLVIITLGYTGYHKYQDSKTSNFSFHAGPTSSNPIRLKFEHPKTLEDLGNLINRIEKLSNNGIISSEERDILSGRLAHSIFSFWGITQMTLENKCDFIFTVSNYARSDNVVIKVSLSDKDFERLKVELNRMEKEKGCPETKDTK